MTTPEPDYPPVIPDPPREPTFSGPPPAPWSAEKTAAWNEEHGALPAGGAIAFEKRRADGRVRLRELRGKGVARMTPTEKDEVLQLLLDRQS